MRRSSDVLSRLAHSHDASRFLQIPKEVAIPSGIADVCALFTEAEQHGRHLTLRGAGTSLSGQAISDDLLVDVRRQFRDVEVLDDGLRVRAGAGATLAAVNARLRRYGRELGPTPASAQAATIGGVLANNATGRLVGPDRAPYDAVESLVVVLPTGRVVDTAAPDADITLTWEDPRLAGGLSVLRRRLRDNEDSLAEIARLWSMRNTMGYDLRALTQESAPSAMLRQLMVGSEGTLGFIAEATFRTVPLRPARRVALAIFDSLDEALATGIGLADEGFDIVQLFDVDALRVVQGLPETHQAIANLELDSQAAVLLEIHTTDPEALAEREQKLGPVLDVLPNVHTLKTSFGAAPLWRVHHGVFNAMAMARPPSTTLLMEDFSVPRDQIASAIAQLNKLFDRYGFLRPPITSDLLTGTVHFMLTENFEDAARLRKFKRFVKSFVRAVLDRRGVLRAQYGTGRVMAPFLEEQVGTELYEVMRGIKHLFDPLGILSPNTMFNESPDSHVSDIKLMPTIEDSVDRCVECGLCESVCPSADLTLTPRQRIVLRREAVARVDDTKLLTELNKNYRYAVLGSCATSSVCQLACPLGIDTGELVRKMRGDVVSENEERVWDHAARNWAATTRLGTTALGTTKLFQGLSKLALRAGRSRYGNQVLWDRPEALPEGAIPRPRPARELTAKSSVAAYFPGCQSTFFGATGQGVFAAFNEVCNRAGLPVSLLNAAELCCGLPWSTRGLRLGYQTMSGHVRRSLANRWRETVVIDSSACTRSIQQMLQPYKSHKPELVDVLDFVADRVLPRLSITNRLPNLLLYPSCANEHLDNQTSLLTIANAVAEEVVVPDSWTCCGGHADRGLLHPEVPQSATKAVVAELSKRKFAAYASTSRSCELTLSTVSGHTFVHLLEVLAQATRPKVVSK